MGHTQQVLADVAFDDGVGGPPFGQAPDSTVWVTVAGAPAGGVLVAGD